MAEKTHIAVGDLERYLKGDLSSDELMVIARHYSGCAECRSVAMGEQGRSVGEVLERAMSATWPAHLTYDEIEGLADRSMPEDSVARAESHLAVCLECRDEVEQLRALATPPDAVASTAGERFGLFDRLRAALLSPGFALAGLAVLVIGVISAFWWVSGNDRTEVARVSVDQQTLDSPQPPALPPVEEADIAEPDEPVVKTEMAVSIKDGKQAVGLDAAGDLVGYQGVMPEQAEMLRSALRTGTISIGPAAREVASASGRRMGTGDSPPTEIIRLTGPVGRVLDSGRPAFTWQPLEGATSYRLEIFDIDYRPIKTSPDLKTVRWNAELPRGKTYIWRVVGLRDAKEISSSAIVEARFHTLAAEKSRELARLRRDHPSSHLLLGLAYANAGMIAEARHELALVRAANPSSQLAKRLLNSLENRQSNQNN